MTDNVKKTKSSYLFSANSEFIEDLYERYLNSSDSVPEKWRQYFSSLPEEAHSGRLKAKQRPQADTEQASSPAGSVVNDVHHAATTQVDANKQVSVLQLINAHRFQGHREANLEPLKHFERPVVDELNYQFHGLTEQDLDSVFNTGSLFGPAEARLRDIIHHVKTTYCGTIGSEYMHINNTTEKRWIQERLEGASATPRFNKASKRNILDRIIAANVLEEYLHSRYVGQKRFSLEGGESLIPLLSFLIKDAGQSDIKEIVIGMAHRGRLNVLINILGKQPSDLFDEFEGKINHDNGSGDVKYHLGYSSNIATDAGPVHVSLAFNPSHLEIIDPVVEGSVRARQTVRGDKAHNQILPVLIHGDAAFAGQGVVMETFNLSQTRGYKTGGTIHIIVNNQIGFTTSDPLDSRSTLYCTDVAKMVQAPIFHVNGDDPEAVILVTQLALEYRMTFNKDVIIDMICFRKHGHSEADEPAATQPIMYQGIRRHPGVREKYSARLIEENVLTRVNTEQMEIDYIASLESNVAVSAPKVDIVNPKFAINYDKYRDGRWDEDVDTSLDMDSVKRLGEKFTFVPEVFKLHPTVQRIITARGKMTKGETPFDWGYAEHMAYASLLEEGYSVRISGQDSGRGTFFHRHAVLHNQKDGETFVPLQYISSDTNKFLVIDSPLSEEAVLGFEYGYASAAPETLTIWEAQFGDFANGAQVVFDQFISSCEAKWSRFCGLTVFLPHGYDGQGPEHSSARLERYLQLCAQENMQVCVPSTAAQMFHMLRRQMLRPYRKPLIVMSPKSLLRNKLSASSVNELIDGKFQNAIDEVDDIDKNKVKRLLFCCGKVYFDLLHARRKNDISNIAIARLEQLFPFPKQAVTEILASYPNLKEVVWVQEEPKNQGSWYYMLSRGTLLGCLTDEQKFGYAGRFYSASPAVGTMSLHLEQQRQLIADALELEKLETTHNSDKLLG